MLEQQFFGRINKPWLKESTHPKETIYSKNPKIAFALSKVTTNQHHYLKSSWTGIKYSTVGLFLNVSNELQLGKIYQK